MIRKSADNPMTPRGRATQASVTRDCTITEPRSVMNLGEDYLGPVFGIINDQSLRLFVKMHSMVGCDKKNQNGHVTQLMNLLSLSQRRAAKV